ncbi:hypothetical protein ACLB2K_066500 [Fragaria x ananassa]
MDARDQLGGSENGEMDRFPDGMRVLAVDDDVTYLKILEASLRKCNYEVTTVNQAKQALEILRENKNKFDLVISDVWMPEMNGFQLLQQLAHEMDLPVVMVSSSDDNELVKKGILNGACCYLVKPVNIEVFETIWQHVFQRKNLNSKDRCKSFDQDKLCNGAGEGEEVTSASSSSEKNGEHRIKRKHQNEDDEGGEDEDENEERSTPKKRRVVWTEAMKKQFDDVYKYLGPEKAVPMNIQKLMNVEGLTRSHVASHLQKYREQLRKGSSNQVKQRASMVVDLGRKDSSSYMLHMSPVDESGGRRLSNAVPLSSYIPPRMLSRSNFPTGIIVNPSSYLLRPGQSQNLCSSLNTSTLQGNPQKKQGTLVTDFYSSRGMNSLNAKLLDNALCRSSNFLGNNGYCQSWQGGMTGCGQLYQTALLRSEDSNFGTLPVNNFGVSSSTPLIQNTPNDLYTTGALFSGSVEDLRENVHIENQGPVAPTTYCTPDIWWEDHTQDYNHERHIPYLVSNAVVDPPCRTLDQNDAVCHSSMESSLFDQFNGDNATIVQCAEVENSTMQTKIEPNEQEKSNDGLVQNSLELLDNQVEFGFLDGEFGFDAIQKQKENEDYNFQDGGLEFHA